MARDKYHELVKQALIVEGWTITDDPLVVSTAIADLEVDLGAEKIVGAERAGEKIAVEIKSFLGRSWLHDFYKAVGQYGFYDLALNVVEPERVLYLAIPDAVFRYLLKEPIANELAKRNNMRFIVYSVEHQKIVLWKN